MDIKFLFVLGTQRTLSKANIVLKEFRDVEPVLVIGRLKPSPIIISSEP